MPEIKTPLVTKAASVANHIARLDKATADFSSKMAGMHKAHHEDMTKALGQLGKVIGLDVAGSGPDPVDIEGLGTENLQTFKSQISSMISDLVKAEVAKLAKVETTVPEMQVLTTVAPTQVEKAADMTEEGLNKAFEGFFAKMNDMVKTQVETSMTEFAKAMYEPLDDTVDARSHFDTNTPGQVPIQKVTPTAGIGDRTQLAQPLARVPTEVTKGAGTEVAAPVLTPDLAKRALNGDQEAVQALMKSAKPIAVPITLTEALQKIH